MKPILALDCRIDRGRASSYTRVLDLLRGGAEVAEIPYVEWFGGPCEAPVLWSTSPRLSGVPEGPKLIATLHDVNPLLPDNRNVFMRWFRSLRFRHGVGKLATRADLVATVSEFARSSIAGEFPALASLLRVVPNYPSPRFCSAIAEGESKALTALEIPDRCVLFVAALRRHKNWETLLRAWASLPVDLRRRHPLVLAGSGQRAGDLPLQIAGELGVADQLHLPGLVDEELLPALYRRAAVFVFPSLAEGFGLPPLEAMASGTAVISSTSTSLPEILGEACEYFDPLSVDELATKLTDLLSSAERRRELSELGLRQAAMWSSQRTGAAMSAALEELLPVPT